MANFSRDPLAVLQENQQKGYVGLYVEQGVPVLDRDLNLLQDLITATVRSLIDRYIGSGVAAAQPGFAIMAIPANNNFQIGAGTALVQGLEVSLDAPINYGDQAGVPNLRTPSTTQPDPREDIVYLEVWLDQVEGTSDADLLNSADVGMQTSVRQRPAWQVLVAENGAPPAPAAGHAQLQLARLTRPRGQAQIDTAVITDLRQTLDNLGGLAARLDLIERLVIQPSFGSPAFLPPGGSPGTAVRIFGNNLNLGTVEVRFGSVVATPTSVTATEIQTPVPTMAAGPVAITVTTDGGSATTTSTFAVGP
jgi:hypothetical protein